MTKTLLISLIAGAAATVAMPAGAADWNEKIDLCAAAVDEKGLAEISDYSIKFAGGGASNVAIKLVPNDGGDTLVAECKIRGGEVKQVAVKA